MFLCLVCAARLRRMITRCPRLFSSLPCWCALTRAYARERCIYFRSCAIGRWSGPIYRGALRSRVRSPVIATGLLEAIRGGGGDGDKHCQVRLFYLGIEQRRGRRNSEVCSAIGFRNVHIRFLWFFMISDSCTLRVSWSHVLLVNSEHLCGVDAIPVTPVGMKPSAYIYSLSMHVILGWCQYLDSLVMTYLARALVHDINDYEAK